MKRVFNKIRDLRTLELHSDNDFYKPFALPVNDIREVWYVRVRISPFLPSPANVQQLLRKEVQELRPVIQKQYSLIQNLYDTIAKMVK